MYELLTKTYRGKNSHSRLTDHCGEIDIGYFSQMEVYFFIFVTLPHTHTHSPFICYSSGSSSPKLCN